MKPTQNGEMKTLQKGMCCSLPPSTPRLIRSSPFPAPPPGFYGRGKQEGEACMQITLR